MTAAPIGNWMWLWQLDQAEPPILPTFRARARRGLLAMRSQLGEAHPTLQAQRHVSARERPRLAGLSVDTARLDRIIARYHANMLDGILLKAFDGEWFWSRQWNKDVVEYLRAGGCRVEPWFYSVGNWQGPAYGFAGSDSHDCTIARELDNVERALLLGCSFIVSDPEKEACLQGDGGYGLPYGEAYLARFGDLPLYAATVPSTTGYWVGNPLVTLASWVSGFCPQVYSFSWDVDAGEWTDRAIRLAYGKSVYPIYESSSGAPPAYMAACAEMARARGLSGVSWWDWQHCTLDQWGGVATAAALGGGGVVPARTPLEDVLGLDSAEVADLWNKVVG